MLSSNGFDLWADGYDESVRLSENDNEYPFAGYKEVLNTIYKTVRAGLGNRILDIGFGTAVLTQKLYNDGYTVFGMDFSQKMLDIGKTKMPDAVLIKHDFSIGFPEEFKNERFDFITCTYAIHHLTDEKKAEFIGELKAHLNPDGLILIGDVAFEKVEDLERCRRESGDLWDDDESYMVEETIKKLVQNAGYEKITFCSGVFTIRK